MAEGRRLRVALAYAGLVLVLAGVTTAAYAAVLPEHRALVVRLAAAALAAVVLLHLWAVLRRQVPRLPSDFERARRPDPPPVAVAPELLKLDEEIRSARADRRFFENVPKPRLDALAARRGRASPPALPPRPLGRGPSYAELAGLVAALEQTRHDD
ncbi:MAG TPA: hypothetical protein VHD15_03785 [Hyphomicrobiales bacterium]|nr:hypothetical protein [Hyphomicrobiales bacterium]